MEASSVGHPSSQIDAVKKIVCIEQIKLVGTLTRLKNIKWSSIGRSRQLVLKNIKILKTTVHNNKPIEKSISKRLQFCQRGEVTLEQHQRAIDEVMTVATGVGFTQLIDVAHEALQRIVDRMEQDRTANAQWITREVRKMRMNSPNSIDTTTLEIMDKNVKLEAVKVKAFIDMAIKVASTIPEILVLSNDQRCSFCNLLGHDPVDCTMAPADKISVSVKQGACLRCLRVHHNEKCTSTVTCEHCNGEHHSTICSTSPKYAETLGYIKPNVRKPCVYCKGPHIALQCKLSAQAKKILIDSENACQRCLSRDHQLDNCQHSYRCRHCKGTHYYLHCSKQEKPEPLEVTLTTKDGGQATSVEASRDPELEQLQKALEWAQSLPVKGTNSNVQGNPKDKQSQRTQEESTVQESNDNNNNKGSKTTKVSSQLERQFNDKMPMKKAPKISSDQISEARAECIQSVGSGISVISQRADCVQTCQDLVPSEQNTAKPSTKELQNSTQQARISNQHQGRSRKRQRGLESNPPGTDNASPRTPASSPSEPSSDEEFSEDEMDIFDIEDEAGAVPCILLAHYSWDPHFIRVKVFMHHRDRETRMPLMYKVAESLEFHRYVDEWPNTKEAITRAAVMIKTFMTKVPSALTPTVVVFFHSSPDITESIINNREVEFFNLIRDTIVRGPLPAIQFFETPIQEFWDPEHDDSRNDSEFREYARNSQQRLSIRRVGESSSENGQTPSDSVLVSGRLECFTAVCCRTEENFFLKIYKLQLDQGPDQWETIYHEDFEKEGVDGDLFMRILTVQALEEIRAYIQHQGYVGYRIKTVLIVHNSASINHQMANDESCYFFRRAKKIANRSLHGTLLRYKLAENIPDPSTRAAYEDVIKEWWNLCQVEEFHNYNPPNKDAKDSLEKGTTDRSSEEGPTQENLLSSEDLQKADHSAPGVSRG